MIGSGAAAGATGAAGMTGIVKGRSAHGAAGLPRGGEVTVSSLYAPVGGEPPRERARRRKAVGRDLERRWGGRWRPRQPQAEDQHTQRSRAASRTAVGGEGSRGESQQRSGVAHQPDRRHTWNGTGVQQLHTRTYTVGAARAGGAEEGGGEEGRGHYRWVGRRSSGERCALERWGGKAPPFWYVRVSRRSDGCPLFSIRRSPRSLSKPHPRTHACHREVGRLARRLAEWGPAVVRSGAPAAETPGSRKPP